MNQNVSGHQTVTGALTGMLYRGGGGGAEAGMGKLMASFYNS